MSCSRSRGQSSLFICASLVAAALAACSDDPAPTAPPGLPRPATQLVTAQIDSQARTGREPEAAATRIALAVPGFGGFAWDTTNGDLIVWVKDLSRGEAARAAVRQYLAANYRGRGGRAGPNPAVRVEAAAFDFLELGSVRDRVNAALEHEPGLRWVGISEQTNTVDVGAEGGAVARIATALRAAGVPAAAIRITTVSPASDDTYDPNVPETFPPVIEDGSIDTTTAAYGAPVYLDSRQVSVAGGAMITYYMPDYSVSPPWLVLCPGLFYTGVRSARS